MGFGRNHVSEKHDHKMQARKSNDGIWMKLFLISLPLHRISEKHGQKTHVRKSRVWKKLGF
jgi:hypothetical protein